MSADSAREAAAAAAAAKVEESPAPTPVPAGAAAATAAAATQVFTSMSGENAETPIDYLSSFQFDVDAAFGGQQGIGGTGGFGEIQLEENAVMMTTEGAVGDEGVGGMSDQSSPETCPPFAKDTAMMLVTDMLPPNLLDGRGFQAFVATLFHGYQAIPRRVLLAELEIMFSRQAARVALALSKSEKFSLSVEVWRGTSENRVFATVHAHCVDQEKPLILHVHHCEPSSVTSATSVASADETGAEDACVSKALSETLRSWKIEESRVISITSPSDVTSRHFPTVQTHITSLHRVFQRAMSQAIERHEQVIMRVKEAIGADDSTLADSGKGSDWLAWCKLVRQCAKANPVRNIAVQEDIATAASLWSLLRPARKAADAMAAEVGFLPLSVARFQLETVLEATTKVSIGRDIDHAVRGTAFHVAQTISDALSAWRAEDRADTMLLSSLLDPRHKSHALSALNSRYGMPEDEAFELLRRHCANEVERLDAMTGVGLVDKELRAFLAQDTSASNSVPLRTWWSVEKSKFPTLALVARKVLCVPSTSAPAERVFEGASANIPPGSLVSRRRALCSHFDVSPAYVQTIMFLHGNMDL